MKRTIAKLLALTLLSVVGMQQAWADGTTAGTTISNKASVNYSIGTTPQATVYSNGDTDTTFVVDRKVNATVVADGAVAASAGATQQMLTFTVTNSSNTVLDFALAAVNAAGNASNATNIKVFVDSDNSGAFNAGDLEQATLGDLGADLGRKVFVFADVPAGAANNENVNIVLTANAIEPADSLARAPGTSAGDEVTDDNADTDTAALQTVLADGAGITDSANAGDFSAEGSFTVQATTINVAKTFAVISDPITTALGGSNPKAIPGAVVQYCITVSNTGGTNAADVAVDDPIPGSTTYVPGSIKVGTTCDYDDAANVAVDDDAIGTDDAATEPVIGSKDGSGIHTRVKTVNATSGVTTTMFRVTIN